METENDKYQIIAALSLGVLGGLLLGNYIWKKHEKDEPLSFHLTNLSKIVEQIEALDTKQINQLKEKINTIIKTIEDSYGQPK